LLVVGNGFDLQCQLNSEYRDFFAWLRKNGIRANGNLWSVHFLNTTPEGQGWVNIEAELHSVLTGRVSERGLFWEWITDAQDFWRNPYGYAISKENAVAHYISGHIKNRNTEFPSYWFLDELIKFEYLFCEFLSEQVDSNANYLSNAKKLTSMLLGDDDEKASVISFNYTNPFIDNDNGEYIDEIGSVANVHGTYKDNNIIFGVDAKGVGLSDARIFTKTHRKMLQPNSESILPNTVDKIKFYGHSLGDADYSYFHSIFDYYNLYGGGKLVDYRNFETHVMLQFYFTEFCESRKAKIKRDAADSVYKLITAYGNSFENEDKGKNLLHKLLLENRIKIEFLPDIRNTGLDHEEIAKLQAELNLVYS